ncbi:MAG: hypothetical protein JWQ50_912 [Caballeronia mineralivorans]|nr:hypothetical protein [Caballeronia mineralivorans]
MVARPHEAVLLEPLHQELEPAVVPQEQPDPMPAGVKRLEGMSKRIWPH